MTDNGDGTYSHSFTLENNAGKITAVAYIENRGITTQWYENPSFSGSPTVTNTTSDIDYYWNGSTDLIVGSEYVSASIKFDTSVRAPYTGSVTFKFYTNFLLNVTFNSAREITGTSSGTYTMTKTLTRNTLYPLSMRWNNQGGDGFIRVKWSYTGQSEITVPSSNYLLASSIVTSSPSADVSK